MLSLFTMFLVVDSRYYGSTNEIKSDEEEAPVTQVNKPPGSAAWVINCAPNQPAKAERGDEETIQQNNYHPEPLWKKTECIQSICCRAHGVETGL